MNSFEPRFRMTSVRARTCAFHSAFRAPEEPGVYELVVDLVHERHRWFGAEASVEVSVGPRRQAVVLVGQPPGDEAFDHRVEEVLARIVLPLLLIPKRRKD